MATDLELEICGRAGRLVPVSEQPLQQVGQRLFEALFSGAVHSAYRASLGVAQERHERLRVVLRLQAPELARLPWETLFDQEEDTYLGGVHDVFSSTGAALVHSGINAVAAMRFTVSDGAAVRFARGFYTALAHGRRIDEAVQSGPKRGGAQQHPRRASAPGHPWRADNCHGSRGRIRVMLGSLAR